MTVIFFDLQRFAGVNKENSSSKITFSGTNDADTLNNRGNNVTIEAQGGNDIITNDSSNTKIYTGDGDDSVYGGKKNVTIDTGSGNDTVSAWGENISVNGGEGDNHIHFYANADNVTALAGSGNDTVDSGAKTASISTGAGNDSVHLYANAEEHTVETGDGDDTISSAGKTASIVTGAGNDSVLFYANAEEHTIDTGDGDDTVQSGAQMASISTGNGDDYILLYIQATKNTVNAGAGNDYIQSYETDGVFYQVNFNDGLDTINGYTSNDTLGIGGTYSRSTVGNDVVVTTQLGKVTLLDAKDKKIKIVRIPAVNTTSNTTINGTAGNDTITNSGENVVINGSSGNDSLSNDAANFVTLDGSAGNDTLRNSNWRQVVLNGGSGKDKIFNSSDYVTIDGGSGNDSIVVENPYAYTTTIYGSAGNDTIIAYGGLIEGGTGADRISLGNYYVNSNATAYASTIRGGTGNDTIYGATVAGHVFGFGVGDGQDIILNFKSNDTVSIDGDAKYYRETVGSNVVITLVDGGSMTLLDASNKTIDINGGEEVTRGENISNTTSNTVVNGTSGNDSIYNYADNVTIDAGAGNDTLNDSFANHISMSGGKGRDSIYGNNNYATITGGDDDDTIVGNHWRSNIFGDNGNDLISLTGYWYNTIDGGSGNDSIIAGGGEHSVNGGAGNDLISLSGGNLTVEGGKGDDTIYADSTQSHLYKYAKGQGSDILYGVNGSDSISVSGGNWSTVTSGNNVLLKVDGSTAMTLIDAKGKTLNIFPTTNPNPDPTPDVTAQDIIKKFMYSLDINTTDSGKAALDKAIKYASNGYFANTDMVIEQMVADCQSLDKNKFLLNMCGIDLTNTDTGAITGSDAGTSTIKTAESVIPESGDLDTSFNWSAFPTENGLNFYLSKTTLSDDEFYIWQALKTWWADESLNLIKESYDYSFLDDDAPVKDITVVFEEQKGGYLAYTGYPQYINGQYTRKLGINKYYYNSFASGDVNGKSPNGQGYLDRTIAHELTHAIMMAKISNFGDLPQFITEGTAELTHGIDDERGDVIEYLANDADALKDSLSLAPGTGGAYEYAGGFMFLRYFAKQSAEHYSSDTTSKSTITNTANLKNITTKSGVLTVKKTYVGDMLDLADYSSSIKKVNATALKSGLMISGNQNANSIVAGTGNDTVFANTGKDTLRGGKGSDVLYGEGGNDKIFGSSGNDSINGGTGNDTLTGGEGSDTFIFGRNFGKDVITDYTAGKDKIKFAVENASVTSYAFSGKNLILTVDNSDTIKIKNGNGKKITVVDASGKSTSTVYSGVNLTNSSSANTTLASGVKVADASSRTKKIKITGNSLANTIQGGSKNDSLYGGSGNDSILGNAGNDKLYGQSGNDKLYGGGGNDSLWGGSGNDSLWGGDGKDKFFYSDGDGKDVIYDFGDNDLLKITGTFSASYSKSKGEVYFKVGTTSKAITLSDFTATTFHVNNDTYKISGSKFKKQ